MKPRRSCSLAPSTRPGARLKAGVVTAAGWENARRFMPLAMGKPLSPAARGPTLELTDHETPVIPLVALSLGLAHQKGGGRRSQEFCGCPGEARSVRWGVERSDRCGF